MGMYTGLRGSVTFKQGISELVNEWWNNDEDEDMWVYVAQRVNYYTPKFKEFTRDRRPSHIPFGAVCYMPDDWSNIAKSILDGNELYFTCSLKNYTGTIQKFIECLPEIADAWDLESRYEEAESGTFYKKEIE